MADFKVEEVPAAELRPGDKMDAYIGGSAKSVFAEVLMVYPSGLTPESVGVRLRHGKVTWGRAFDPELPITILARAS